MMSQGDKSGKASRTEFVPIDRISVDPSLQMRTGELTDPATVDRYVEDMRRGDEFPPIKVTNDGSDCYWLFSGFHRLAAIERRNDEGDSLQGSVKCEIVAGGYLDAMFLALGGNRTHGLPRTNEDKQKAIETLLTNDALVQMAMKAAPGRGGLHEALAQATGTSRGTIGRYLDLNGLHVSGNKVVRKETPANTQTVAPLNPAGKHESARQNDDIQTVAPLNPAGKHESARQNDDGQDGDGEEAAEPLWTAPVQSPREKYLEQVATFRAITEKFAETVEGRELIDWQPDGESGPLVINILDTVADGLRESEAKARIYVTNRDRAQVSAIAHGIAVSGGAEAQALPAGSAACPLLRKLEEKVRGMDRAARKATAARDAA